MLIILKTELHEREGTVKTRALTLSLDKQQSLNFFHARVTSLDHSIYRLVAHTLAPTQSSPSRNAYASNSTPIVWPLITQSLMS